jgi:phage-related baseplate assembly protein
MNRLGVLDPKSLPRFEVLEALNAETILEGRMGRFVELWKEHDPPAGAAYDAEGLEFDPIKITQEASTYFELLLRDRVNQAARSVTLAFAASGDLDAIASRYPGGVPRLTDEQGNPDEDDERYRRRIWLSPATLSPHGTEEAYVFWALTADRKLHDASATTVEGTGRVKIAVMGSRANPLPTQAQLLAVRAFVPSHSRKALTDIVSVVGPTVVETRYVLDVWLFPGADAKVVFGTLRRNLEDLVKRQAWLGFDHTRMAIAAAAEQVNGVSDIRIVEPADTVAVDLTGCVQVTGIDLNPRGRG